MPDSMILNYPKNVSFYIFPKVKFGQTTRVTRASWAVSDFMILNWTRASSTQFTYLSWPDIWVRLNFSFAVRAGLDREVYHLYPQPLPSKKKWTFSLSLYRQGEKKFLITPSCLRKCPITAPPKVWKLPVPLLYEITAKSNFWAVFTVIPRMAVWNRWWVWQCRPTAQIQYNW